MIDVNIYYKGLMNIIQKHDRLYKYENVKLQICSFPLFLGM